MLKSIIKTERASALYDDVIERNITPGECPQISGLNSDLKRQHLWFKQ